MEYWFRDPILALSRHNKKCKMIFGPSPSVTRNSHRRSCPRREKKELARALLTQKKITISHVGYVTCTHFLSWKTNIFFLPRLTANFSNSGSLSRKWERERERERKRGRERERKRDQCSQQANQFSTSILISDYFLRPCTLARNHQPRFLSSLRVRNIFDLSLPALTVLCRQVRRGLSKNQPSREKGKNIWTLVSCHERKRNKRVKWTLARMFFAFILVLCVCVTSCSSSFSFLRSYWHRDLSFDVSEVFVRDLVVVGCHIQLEGPVHVRIQCTCT